VLEFVFREESKMPMTMIQSHDATGIRLLTDRHDEKFDEDMVKIFISKANRMRRAQGLSDLCVGALASPGLDCLIRVNA